MNRYNGFHKKHPNSHGPWNPSHEVNLCDHAFCITYQHYSSIQYLCIQKFFAIFLQNAVRWMSVTCLLMLTGSTKGELSNRVN